MHLAYFKLAVFHISEALTPTLQQGHGAVTTNLNLPSTYCAPTPELLFPYPPLLHIPNPQKETSMPLFFHQSDTAPSQTTVQFAGPQEVQLCAKEAQPYPLS